MTTTSESAVWAPSGGPEPISFTVDELAALSRVLDLPEVAALERPGRPGEVTDEQFQYGVAAGIRSLLVRDLIFVDADSQLVVPVAIRDLITVMADPELFVMCRREAAGVLYASVLTLRSGLLVERVPSALGIHTIAVRSASDLSESIRSFSELVERPRPTCEPLEIDYAGFDRASTSLSLGDAKAAIEKLVADGVPVPTAEAYVAAGRSRVNSIDLQVFRGDGGASMERSGYVGWIDGGGAGLWLLPAPDGQIFDPANLSEPVAGADAVTIQAIPTSAVEIQHLIDALL